MSQHFTPSAASLQVFDEVKREVDKKRSAALRNLGKVPSNNKSQNRSDGCDDLPAIKAMTWSEFLHPSCGTNTGISDGKSMEMNEGRKLTNPPAGSSYGMVRACQRDGNRPVRTEESGAGEGSSSSSFGFTPSTESLAVFDAIKQEVDSRRKPVLARLRGPRHQYSSNKQGGNVKARTKPTCISWWDALPRGTGKNFMEVKSPNEIMKEQGKEGRASEKSSESLALFDEIMGKTGKNRTGDMLSLKPIKKHNTSKSQNESVEMTISSVKRDDEVRFDTFRAMRECRRSEANKKFANAKSAEQVGMKARYCDRQVDSRWTTLWPHGKSPSVKRTTPSTVREREARKWCERVKTFQRKLQGTPPEDANLWDRAHIPKQLLSSRPSPVSGASTGWELDKERVVQMRESMERPYPFNAIRKALTWVQSKFTSMICSIPNKYGLLMKGIFDAVSLHWSRIWA